MKDIFEPQVNHTKKPEGESYFVVFNTMNILLKDDKNDNIIEGKTIPFPLLESEKELGMEINRLIYLGILNGYPCFGVETTSDNTTPGTYFCHLFETHDLFDFSLFLIAQFAYQIITWDRTYTICGQCGAQAENLPGERAKKCPQCGLVNYPRISPSIIVAVLKDKEILLARAQNFPAPFFSTLAGFVEPGETLEECVAREVMEETAIEIEDITYVTSQPWGISNSLMIGFTAKYKSGEIVIDENELAEAGWFSFENLPFLPPESSIACKLINYCKKLI